MTLEKVIQVAKKHEALINYTKQLQATKNQNAQPQHNASVVTIQDTKKQKLSKMWRKPQDLWKMSSLRYKMPKM